MGHPVIEIPVETSTIHIGQLQCRDWVSASGWIKHCSKNCSVSRIFLEKTTLVSLAHGDEGVIDHPIDQPVVDVTMCLPLVLPCPHPRQRSRWRAVRGRSRGQHRNRNRCKCRQYRSHNRCNINSPVSRKRVLKMKIFSSQKRLRIWSGIRICNKKIFYGENKIFWELLEMLWKLQKRWTKILFTG